MTPYVKGYKFSMQKAASLLGVEPDNSVLFKGVRAFRKLLDPDAYIRITGALPIGQTKGIIFLVVLDEDYDLEALKQRSLPPLHPSLQWSMPVLDELGIWKSI